MPGEIFDFGGVKVAQGIGGTKMSIDADGNISVQSGGNALGSDAANIALGIGGANFGPIGSAVTAGLNPQFGNIPLNDFLGAGGLLGSNKTNSMTFSPAAAITGLASNKVFSSMAPGLAKKVFEESGGNMNLTKGSLVGANMLTNEAIGKAVESLDLGTLDLLGGGSNTPTGGGNVKSNVNVSSSGETSSVQSDLKSGTGVSPDAAGETQLSQNLTSSQQSSTGGNDGGGGQDAASDFLKAMPETLDVNTLQNLNPTNTTPLTTMNNDASLMMNSISPTFGGRYLQRGRNRDTGSVTTRRATQREVDKDKRRSGILFG